MTREQDRVYVSISGHDIYEQLWMPEAPRKGDILWLSSLTRGACPVREAVVSKVEWVMEQQSGNVYARLSVRRIGVTPTSEPLPSKENL